MPNPPIPAPSASKAEPIEALLVELDDDEAVAPPGTARDLESESPT